MKGRVLVLVCFLCTLLAPEAYPQSLRGSIGGVVTDASQLPLPDVRVSLVHEGTNKSRTATTDAQGEFLVSLLPPGSYRLEAEREGYRKHLQRVVLLINQEIRIEVPLLPGSVSQQIEVTTTREWLKTDSTAIRTVLENRLITGLPLDGRNFLELSLLVPGAAPAAPGSAGSIRGDFALHVSGSREDSNQFLLDGVYNGDPKLNNFGVTPPVDAILEFEVVTSNYDASFGRNVGGQVNVALKTGTNQFHGTAYEFFRNAAFDARNHFAPGGEPDPQFQRNQFGFSLGGPLRQDQTFFFADYEGRILRQGITRITNIPTLRERAGDFSALNPAPDVTLSCLHPVNVDSICDPATANFDPAAFFPGFPFPGNIIPAGRMDSIGLAIAALYPAPNRQIPEQNFVSSPTLRDEEHHFDVRLDHAVGNSSDLSVRYSFSDREFFEPFSGTTFAAVPGYGTNVPRRAQNLMVSETHVFSPILLNEIRVGFNRVAAGAFHENAGTSVNTAVGLPELSSNPRDFGLSFIRVTGFSPLGDEFNNPQDSASDTFQVLDHTTYARGSHLLKFGFDFRALRQNAFRDVQARGFLDFLGLTGNPLADLLLGLPAITGGARLDNPQRFRSESYSFFAQDSYHLRPSLTLTAGVRYEYISPPVDARDRANVYDPASQSLVPVGSGGIPRAGYEADKNNWGPRVGLAWAPGSAPDTVLRAGYGIYFEQSALAPGEGLYFNAPFFDFKLFFTLPGLPLTLSNPFPSSFPVTLPSSALAFQRDLRTPYVQHWNLNIQRKLGANRVVEVGYVGSRGTGLLTARDINQPSASPTLPNPRPVPQFDDITLVESRASSSYHSLQARFQQSLAFGLSVLSSYTWSKSLDDASNFFSSAGDANFPQDSFNLRGERGRSNFDLRHRLSIGYSYDFPVGKGSPHWSDRGWVSSLLGGWQTFGILILQGGRPFTVALLPEIDNSNTGRSILGFGANDRPNQVGDPRLSSPTAEQWFNTAAFAIPAFGSFGNAGRNILEGPGFQTLNASLVKNVSTRQKMNLQFRAEFFNLFNRTNLDLPNIFVGSPTFGHILSAQTPRRIQFGLKLLF